MPAEQGEISLLKIPDRHLTKMEAYRAILAGIALGAGLSFPEAYWFISIVSITECGVIAFKDFDAMFSEGLRKKNKRSSD
jgi:hypothetical protein